MVSLIDTHCHVYLKHFDTDLDAVIESAKKQGVQKILMPNVDEETVDRLHHLADTYPGYCIPMMGLHPCDVEEDWEEELERLLAWFDKRTYIAVGEIGLDLYWDKTTLDRQVQALKRQIEFAIVRDLPVVLHTRDSTDKTLDVLSEYKGTNLRGVLHCFSGSYEQAQRAIKLNMMLGIGGVLTFKNAGIAEVVKHIDLEHIILETDAPYLPPVPHRGKRNEPGYVYHVAAFLAELRGQGIAEIGKVTSANAERLFKIGGKN
jgi:TatD DNase family protein